jgi:hypothetical protein
MLKCFLLSDLPNRTFLRFLAIDIPLGVSFSLQIGKSKTILSNSNGVIPCAKKCWMQSDGSTYTCSSVGLSIFRITGCGSMLNNDLRPSLILDQISTAFRDIAGKMGISKYGAPMVSRRLDLQLVQEHLRQNWLINSK